MPGTRLGFAGKGGDSCRGGGIGGCLWGVPNLATGGRAMWECGRFCLGAASDKAATAADGLLATYQTRFGCLSSGWLSYLKPEQSIYTESMSWLALALTPGVGPAKFMRVLSAGEPNPDSVAELLGADLARAYRKVLEAGAAGRLRQRAVELGVRLVGAWESEYPERLRHLADPPPLVYLRGEWDFGNPAVAIVGSRRAQPWALDFARRLARELAEEGVGVISGLARGVDTASHKGALEGGGSTIGVLGSGVNVVYPPENAELAQKITLMSELPLDAGPSAGSFPRRNRIIAALADAVVIVQAPEKSGALITAALAAEIGREVLAVPGRPGDWASRGSNGLLRDGAGVVLETADVLGVLGMGLDSEGELLPEPEGEAGRLWRALRERGESLPDDLAQDLGLSPVEILGLLTQLELSGHVRSLPGGRYEVT